MTQASLLQHLKYIEWKLGCSDALPISVTARCVLDELQRLIQALEVNADF